jgi:hypothetical protein
MEVDDALTTTNWTPEQTPSSAITTAMRLVTTGDVTGMTNTLLKWAPADAWMVTGDVSVVVNVTLHDTCEPFTTFDAHCSDMDGTSLFTPYTSMLRVATLFKLDSTWIEPKKYGANPVAIELSMKVTFTNAVDDSAMNCGWTVTASIAFPLAATNCRVTGNVDTSVGHFEMEIKDVAPSFTVTEDGTTTAWTPNTAAANCVDTAPNNASHVESTLETFRTNEAMVPDRTPVAEMLMGMLFRIEQQGPAGNMAIVGVNFTDPLVTDIADTLTNTSADRRKFAATCMTTLPAPVPSAGMLTDVDGEPVGENSKNEGTSALLTTTSTLVFAPNSGG